MKMLDVELVRRGNSAATLTPLFRRGSGSVNYWFPDKDLCNLVGRLLGTSDDTDTVRITVQHVTEHPQHFVDPSKCVLMETLQLITCANRVAASLSFLDGFLHGEPGKLLTGHSINPDRC